jgi:hypothetical protein
MRKRRLVNEKSFDHSARLRAVAKPAAEGCEQTLERCARSILYFFSGWRTKLLRTGAVIPQAAA